MGERWRIRLAGPLEVAHEDVLVPVAAAKQRVLIAVLALAAGEPVTPERLITCLWDDQPPSHARNTLQNHVLRLRRTLAAGGAPCPLTSTAAGYCLDVPAERVDVHQFGSLVRRAQSSLVAGEAEQAAGLLDEALGLWRGEPLADVPSDVLHREVVPGLAEQHLAAVEQRIGLDLERGRHAEQITGLVALATQHPLRERIWAQLMLALYRSGRTAEALDTYRQASEVLAAELGIDPGPELRKLHQAMLTGDPALTVTAAGPRPVAARPGVPRQLPPPGTHFVGRTEEMRRLSAHLEAVSGSPVTVISAIGGSAGIGKTALALHWGHQHADQFPDGQLYVNLRGFGPAGPPVSPMAAMRGFLTALGVPARQLPAEPDEQAARYRSELAGRRMLVVLDNAGDADQVRPLLPGAPGCLVLVTSRDQLTGLVAVDGAVPLTLDLLTRDEARDLLIHRLGRGRVEREVDAASELIGQCARLPLALNIAAARAAVYPARPLASFAAELRDARRRLDALATGDAAADVRGVFFWSYRALTPESARVFRLLGLHPGPDISLAAAASLVGRGLEVTRRAVDDLTRAHLLTEHAPGRYSLHDLLRAYAAEQAGMHDDAAARQAALRRAVDFYTHTACGAELLLTPHRAPITLGPPAPGVHLEPLPDGSAALAWLDAEHPGLLAAQQAAAACAWHLEVWQLAWALTTVQLRRGHRHDHLAVWLAALEASAHLPGASAQMLARRRLGSALAELGRHDEAITHLHRSLALAENSRDLDQQAETHRMLAWAFEQQNNDRQALEHTSRTLDLRRALGQRVQEAQALNQMGWYLARLGDFETARTHCEAALAIQRRHHAPSASGEAATLDSLGYIAHHQGHPRQAIEYYQQALRLLTDAGHILHTADVLDNLGHPHAALGEYQQARVAWRRALQLYRELGRDQSAGRLQRQLDALGEHPGG